MAINLRFNVFIFLSKFALLLNKKTVMIHDNEQNYITVNIVG